MTPENIQQWAREADALKSEGHCGESLLWRFTPERLQKYTTLARADLEAELVKHRELMMRQIASYAALEAENASITNDALKFVAERDDLRAEVERLTKQNSTITEAYEQESQDCSRYAAEVESLKADVERLDWLAQNFFHRENLDWVTGKVSKESNMWVFFAPVGVQGDVRDVIDAAMKGTQ